MIRWDGESWWIRDLGSRNGTYVDDAAVPQGGTVPLRSGACVAFGARAEAWELVDACAPQATLMPIDGGEPIFLSQAINGIPTKEEPQATAYLDGETWLLEHDDSKVPLEKGCEVVVAGRTFRFDCPSIASATTASTERDWTVVGATLILEVSRDEEHVSLTIAAGDRRQEFGERACFYLVLVLARERLRAGTDTLSGGWLAVEDLLRMVPDYASGMHLNVEIFRLRRLLSSVGCRDAAAIIERRRGQIRLGSDQVEIRRPPMDVV